VTDARQPKRLHIKTFGCQMNVYDSERIEEAMAPLGYAKTETPQDADLVVVNTCHIREKAAEKLYSELGHLRAMKEDAARQGRTMLVAVTGCVAQAEGDEVRARAPVADFVLGPQAYHHLPELVSEATGERVVLDLPVNEKFDVLPGERARGGVSRFLTVQEGCDKFCTFCVVPYTRGAEWSRPVDAVVAEARQLVAAGAREITLLGQNVNAYHGEAPAGDEAAGTYGLGRLVRHLARLEGLERIRFTTSHPRDMPVQAGSDRILKAMNRGHTAEAYIRLIERIRAERPDLALSGDFIVGFPGEREQDFEDTLSLVRAVGYASAFSFKYSRRPGTPGADLGFQIPEDVKSQRLSRLQALLSEQKAEFDARALGERLPVLLEKPGRKPGQLIGRSPYLQSVVVEAPEHRIGRMVDVTITAVRPNSLQGSLQPTFEERQAA
jgi:tRNA-2-methylthio-N6-dimethylallyladenosine synthase